MNFSIRSIFPLIDRMSDYRLANFKGDLNAGITVGIILIPQGMAYSVLAGLPPVYGLYTGLIPLILYGLLGTSRELAVGPVALLPLLVLAGVSGHADPGTERFIQLSILTAFGVGIVKLVMGVLRMGFLVNFLSHPVLSGFISAAAVIIGASQLKNLLGIELPDTHYVHQILIAFIHNIETIHLPTALIGLISLGILITFNKWNKKFPAALLVVIIGILIVANTGLEARGVSIVGDVPGGLPSFSIAFFNFNDAQLLMPIILVIALVSYIESIALAKSLANQKGYKVDNNKELVALGITNIGGSLFQSFPATGSFSRTAVNNQAGAQSGVAGLISAGIIALTLLFLTPLFFYLPSAVLAAIILTAVTSLFNHKEMLYLWQTDKKDLAMLSVTFLATLILGIEAGVAIGVFASLAMVIYSSTKPHSTELGRLGDSNTFRNVKRFPHAHVYDDTLIFRFDAPLYFANVENFTETIYSLIDSRRHDLRYFILDASVISWVDSTGIRTLKEMTEDLRSKGIDIILTSTRGPVRDKLLSSGVTKLIGPDNFYNDVYEAVDAIQV